jgi:ubiquinone/menaquinone biosynthesis C-methylase UbiE
VNHADHVALIRSGVEGAGPRWLELGAGEGAFTLALVDVLGPDARVIALDRDRRALETMRRRVSDAFPGASVEAEVADFTRGLPDGPFDGVLAANSLHFVRTPDAVLAAIRDALAPGGSFVLVEYDADRGNPWVPHPISFDRWRRQAPSHGFEVPRLIHRVPSRFLNAIYGAVANPR